MLTQKTYRKAMAGQGVVGPADYKRRIERQVLEGLGDWKAIEAQLEKLLNKGSPTLADLKLAGEFRSWMQTVLSLLKKGQS